MFYVGEAQLPRPEVNVPIFDLDGYLLGIGDLLDPEAGMVTEFDGQDHRLRRRHRADNLREEKLEAANLVVCRVDSLDLAYAASHWPSGSRPGTRKAGGVIAGRTVGPWTNLSGGAAAGPRERAAACCGWQARPTATGCLALKVPPGLVSELIPSEHDDDPSTD